MVKDWKKLVDKVIGKYEIIEILGEGENGITFKANDVKLGTYVSIKVIKNENIDETWIEEPKQAAKVKNCYNISLPLDFDEETITLDDEDYVVKYIVWEYINDNAITVYEFIENSPNITGELILEILNQLCIAVNSMQNHDVEHGDLHERNILLVPPAEYNPRGNYLLKILDFGFAKSLRGRYSSDVKSIGRIIQHFWDVSQNYEDHLVMGDKKFIKTLPTLISKIMEDNPERRIDNPIEILRRIEELRDESLIDYSSNQKKMSNPFQYLSVEEIPEDSDLLSYLFTGTLPWYEDIENFGTMIISGHRGCGKSMVLKNMRLITKLMSSNNKADLLKDNYVGFYLQCTHNFYVPFGGKSVEYDKLNSDMMLHYFNLLYTYEIVESLKLYENVFSTPFQEFSKKTLYDFVSNYLEKKSILLENMNIYNHLLSLLEREIKLMQQYIVNHKSVINFTGTNYLINLVDMLVDNFSLFKSKKIYFLMDDYSDGRGVDIEIQKSLNRVIGIRNENFCFKVSTEKYAFYPYDIDGNQFAQDREYRILDLSKEFLTYQYKKQEKKFIKLILNKRLKMAGVDRDIEKLLGNYKFLDGNIGNSLGNPNTRKDTLYAGFNTICNLCSGDISTLLELCRDIYQSAIIQNKLPENKESSIDFKLQDRIIKDFSRYRMSIIKDIPMIGNELYEIAHSMGTISNKYLTEYGSTKEPNKKREYYREIIRIDIKGSKQLADDVEHLYKGLIKYGIFTDVGVGYLWGKSITNLKLIFRKIYAPAYNTSYRNRQALILSPARFEVFLRNPSIFSRRGTKFLDGLAQITLDEVSYDA